MNVGVIGLGYWGPNLIRNLLESQRANVHCFEGPVPLRNLQHIVKDPVAELRCCDDRDTSSDALLPGQGCS
jgi:hypothetical protein